MSPSSSWRIPLISLGFSAAFRFDDCQLLIEIPIYGILHFLTFSLSEIQKLDFTFYGFFEMFCTCLLLEHCRYRAHLQEDDAVPVELCDAAVLKITDATTMSVGPSLSTVLTEATPDSTTATAPTTPPAAGGDETSTSAERRRLRRWLDLCHCERHLIAIKLFYFTFIGALGVGIAYAIVFLKQIGLSPFQIGIISGIRPVLGFVSAPAWGAIADRYNIRRVLMLISMVAWLAFFSGLYFVEAPTRRIGGCPGCPAHQDVLDQISNTTVVSAVSTATQHITTTTSVETVTTNASKSGTIVDGRLHVTGHVNSSTAATTYVAIAAACRNCRF